MNALLPDALGMSWSWETMLTTASTTTACYLYVLVVILSFLSLYVTAATGFRIESFLKRWTSESSCSKHSNSLSSLMDRRRTLSRSELSASLSSMIPWWDDLAPPFALAASENSLDDEFTDHQENFYEEGLEVEGDAEDATRPRTTATTLPSAPCVTHFCFLVHGHRGMARDLAYLEEVMRLLAKRQKLKLRRRRHQSLSSSLSTSELQRNSQVTTGSTTSDDDDDEQSDVSISSSTSTSTPPRDPIAAATVLLHDLVIHSSGCNEGKTTDGVANGGDRLVEEMLTVIRNVMEQQRSRQQPAPQRQNEQSDCDISDSSNDDISTGDDSLQDITLSVVGNSLGGIYSRYAVAQLVRKCAVVADADNSVSYILDGRFRLHLNIFCTTASPHLGVSGHTYLPIPRTAELGVAHAMGLTGKDLFRVNDLMKRMATTAHFLTPLSQFRKRIAYANAYGTDFPVPAATAAFLSPASIYPHYFSAQRTNSSNTWDGDNDDDTDEDEAEENGLIIATLHTPAQSLPALEHGIGVNVDDETIKATSEPGTSSSITEQDSSRSNTASEPESQADDLLLMSTSLDSLGWKKVFVDIRREIPIAVSLPTKLLKRNKSESLPSDATTTSFTASGTTATTTPDQSSSQRSPSPELRPTTLQELRQRRRVESRDVATAVCSAGDNVWNLPIGHNMIVAFSRSRISTLINKGGRPVVDSLAKELVEDIFSWKSSSSTTSKSGSITSLEGSQNDLALNQSLPSISRSSEINVKQD